MPRKRKEEVKPGAPEWLTTYGDMITLVLTFFILLYSFSSLDIQKFRMLVVSLQGSLGALDGGKTFVPGPALEQGDNGQNAGNLDKYNAEFSKRVTEYMAQKQAEAQEKAKLEKLKKDMEKIMTQYQLKGQTELHVEERGLVVRFVDSAFFDLGKADLRPEAKNILKQVAAALKPLPNNIRIEGHTDNLPIHNSKFPSNWELSVARATEVIRFLAAEGMPGQRLSAAGYGEFKPLVPNTSPENRQKNRRIDIVILDQTVSNKTEPR